MRLASWTLNLLYGAILIVAAPVLLHRYLVAGKYREGWREKFLGLVPQRNGKRRCVWFHAVSVGEVLLLRPVIAGLRRAEPGLDVWISTMTSTGQAVARETFPDARVIYFPLDFSWSARRALRRVRPDLIALVELELWPNFIAAAHAAGVPLVLVNGRMSDRSHRGYRWIARFVSGWLKCFDVLTAQTQADADRLLDLGAPADRVAVTGSVKFDGLPTDRANNRTLALRAALGIRADEIVFIAGSTQAPEEAVSLRVYRRLKPEFPKLRLIVVPRHKERFDEVAQLIERNGLPLTRRSSRIATGDATGDQPVILLDTLGELSSAWGLAEIAFVGGSLSPRGGQNMLEPAAYGAAVLFGPNTFNFRHAVELLLSRKGALVVNSEDEMAAILRLLLNDAPARVRVGERAREVVLTQQGATDRVLEAIRGRLPRPANGPCRERAA